MWLPARFPRVAAWLMTLALLGLTTVCALQGLRALEPGAPDHLDHVHGVITAMRGGGVFAVRVSGRPGVVWFRIARGAHISLAHLERHLHEQAATDVYYVDQPREPLLAWLAD
jgi:hypothetical protein